jgi:CheY-like chemotaxis protein
MSEPRLRVLVAEDETIIRLDLCGLLSANGIEVCAEARDGQEAVTLARTAKPDLAILDIRMPKLDGLEAARRIIEDRPIPIVMLTALADEATVARAVDAGVYAYLTKPFREQDVLPAIRLALARHNELAATRRRTRIDVHLPSDR